MSQATRAQRAVDALEHADASMSAGPESAAGVTLQMAMDACPFRSVITRNPDAEILGVWAIIGHPALPVPAEILAEADAALRQGASYLVMSDSDEQRTIGKRALMLRLGMAEGHA